MSSINIKIFKISSCPRGYSLEDLELLPSTVPLIYSRVTLCLVDMVRRCNKYSFTIQCMLYYPFLSKLYHIPSTDIYHFFHFFAGFHMSILVKVFFKSELHNVTEILLKVVSILMENIFLLFHNNDHAPLTFSHPFLQCKCFLTLSE
jgi:hypothetical protein